MSSLLANCSSLRQWHGPFSFPSLHHHHRPIGVCVCLFVCLCLPTIIWRTFRFALFFPLPPNRCCPSLLSAGQAYTCGRIVLSKYGQLNLNFALPCMHTQYLHFCHFVSRFCFPFDLAPCFSYCIAVKCPRVRLPFMTAFRRRFIHFYQRKDDLISSLLAHSIKRSICWCECAGLVFFWGLTALFPWKRVTMMRAIF